VIESFVDLTYRGLSLGRRIKLSQVRPSSGHLELAIPMPVGTHVAIATDDGVTFDATVSWVYEQVAGTDRTPGMVVVPVLAADPAASWWKARVALPDEEKPKPRASRHRPVTVRPRAQTDPAPPPEGAITDELPTMIADLDARVAAAAGILRRPPTGDLGEAGERRTTVVDALDPQVPAQPIRGPDGESAMRLTGDHDVIDDGRKTMIMARVDPATLDLEPGASGQVGASGDTDAGRDAGADGDPSASDDGDDPDASETTEAGDDPGAGGAREASEAGAPGPGDKPPAGRGFKKRRKRW
jgi:hypothetical protein